MIRGFFHATNYLGLEVADSPSAGAVTDVLRKTLLDDLPETPQAAAMMLSWLLTHQEITF